MLDAMTLASALLGIVLSAPPSPAADEAWFLTPDGTRIFYKKMGSGPATAVFLPAEGFRGTEPALARLAAGRALVVYDRRGTGLSQVVTDPARLTASDHVRDLEALRRHLRVPRLQLIGEGLGAGLAVLYARAHPARVDRILLIAPMAPARALMGEPAPPPADDTPLAGDVPPSALANRENVRAAALASLGEWDFRPWLGAVAAPALVIGAPDSPSGDATRAWAAELPAARFLAVPGSAGDILRGEAFADGARRFLAGRFPADAELVGESDAH
jgi:pimeloyl-ACP methyl ester carboxylesterase